MSKVVTILLFLIVTVTQNASAESWTNNQGIIMDTEAQETRSRLDDLIKNLDLDHFIDSIEIDFADWKTCGGQLLGIPGIAGCYDEPVVMADYSTEPLKIQSLGISLGTDIQRSGYSRRSMASINVFGHTNLIKFPLLGMIMDSKFMCFQGGELSLTYMSGFDPLYDGMFTRMIFADISVFFKPELMLLGFADCAAASVSNYFDGLSTAGSFNSRLRMAFPHYMGCWNSFPMGGWSHQSDPIVAGATSISFALASAMRVGGIGKTIRIKGMDGSMLPETMCGEKISPLFVKPQFLFQLIYPTTSQVVPLGATPPEWAEFKNKPDSVDNSAFWVWKRKCLYLGAAECSRD